MSAKDLGAAINALEQSAAEKESKLTELTNELSAVKILLAGKQRMLQDSASGTLVSCEPIDLSPLHISVSVMSSQAEKPTPTNPIDILGIDTVNITRCGANILSNNVVWSVPPSIQFRSSTENFMLSPLTEGYQDDFAFYELPLYALQGKTITLYGEWSPTGTSAALAVAWLDDENQIVGTPLILLDRTGTSAQCTIPQMPDDAAKLCGLAYPDRLGETAIGSTVSFRKMHIDAGAFNASIYYSGMQYPVSFGRAFHGLPGFEDTIHIDRGTAIRYTGVAAFTGAEAWAFKVNDNNEFCSAYISGSAINALFDPMMLGSALLPFACSHLPYVYNKMAYSARTQNMICGYNDNSAAFMLTFRRDEIGSASNAAEFKAWLMGQHALGTPFTILYPLAEPIEAAISPMKITSQMGRNTVYTDIGTLDVTWHTTKLLGYSFDV